MANRPISFYKYLKDQAIEIPIIQRDYAQGRIGKEALRKTFLTSLKKVLDDAICAKSDYKPLQLDFVYGSTLPPTNSGDITIQPLDGQQRLTTLWLLHWYIALRAGKLAEAGNTLMRFSYETRISSRTFCEKMCAVENFEAFLEQIKDYENPLKKDESCINNDDLKDVNKASKHESGETNKTIPRVADFIETRTWFYSKWKQDPTIQSMLRMLSSDKEESEENGRKRKNKKDLKIDHDNDAIEKIFASTPKVNFIKYWELLISDRSPIVFYHLSLNKFGLSDDLYVKMNARGKALTPFENFKADLVGYMLGQREKEEKKEKSIAPDELKTVDLPWKRIVDPRDGVPILMDTTWANLFWKYRSVVNQIDEAFLTFLNRFFWNELFITGIALENNISYIHLNKDNGAVFDDFSPYLYDKGAIPVTFFDDLITVLNRFGKYNREVEVPNQKAFNYRPIYIDKEKGGKNVQVVEEITQSGRIFFFAITKYFKEGEYDHISFQRWIRVVSNLISGVDEDGSPQIRSVEQVRIVIDKLAILDSHKIYDDLVKQEINQDYSKPLNLRFNEEIEKARQILDDDRSELRVYPFENRFKTWEEAINKYETFSFFKGSIRFLYHNEKGAANWDDFDKKSKNAEKFFSKDNGYYLSTNEVNGTKNNAYLLKLLYSYTDVCGFRNAMWWKYHVYSNNDNSWLHLLNHPDMSYAVHHLMTKAPLRQYKKPTKYAFEDNVLYLLSQTRLLDYVAENMPNPWIRDYHNHKAIYPSSTGIFLNATFRDQFLQTTDGISLAQNCSVEDTGLLFGSNINFLYNYNGIYHFRWYSNDDIYLTSDIDSDCIIRNKDGQNDMEKYFMFKAKDIIDKTQILENLNRLISEYNGLKS